MFLCEFKKFITWILSILQRCTYSTVWAAVTRTPAATREAPPNISRSSSPSDLNKIQACGHSPS